MKKIALFLALVLLLGTFAGCGARPAMTDGVQTASGTANDAAFTEPAQLTRADLEQAAMAAAWAYYFKYAMVQYDSAVLSPDVGKLFGGTYRLTENVAPEFGSADATIFSVCSDFCHKVWLNGANINVLGDPLSATTASMWVSSIESGLSVFLWASDEYEFTATDEAHGMERNNCDLWHDSESAKAWFTDYEKNLRPGDIICAGTKSAGHAVLYLGNGYIFDCWGGKYDMKTGVDKYEKDGALTKLHDVIEVMVDMTDNPLKIYGIGGKSSTRLTVLRPTNLLCTDDGDGNLANDVVTDKEYHLPQSTLAREHFNGLSAERTVSNHNYQSAAVGETITYSVTVTNHSNDADYLTFRHRADAAYNGEAITALPITETVPEGTELVSADGAAVDGKNLSWTVDLAAGESKTVSYTVKVTAPRGTVIKNSGGMVSVIPTNELTTPVCGVQLSAEDTQKLAEFGSKTVQQWYDEYHIGAAKDLDFAESIYRNVLGIGLDLPDSSDLWNEIFEKYHHVMNPGYGYATTKSTDIWPYVQKAAGDSLSQQLLVPGYFGGNYVYVARPNRPLIDLRYDYLQPGDILVNLMLGNSVESEEPSRTLSSSIAVYLGNETFALKNEDNDLIVKRGVWAKQYLWTTMMYDGYLLLRPTLAYDDVHTLTAVPDTTAEMPEQLKPVEPNAQIGAANLSALQSLTAAGLDNKNLAQMTELYTKAGMPSLEAFLTVDGKALTVVTLMTKFAKSTEDELTGSRRYTMPETVYDVAEDCRDFFRLVLPDFYGGKGFLKDGEPMVGTERSLASLEVGDIVAIANWETSRYCTMLYQGNGKFIRCDYIKDGAKTIDQVTLDDAGFNAQLNDEAFLCYYAIRPTNAIKDINAK